MSAIADLVQSDTKTTAPVRMADGARMILRGLQRLVGAALCLAAVGLWIAPGSSWESEILLFKLILSLSGFLAGFGLMSASGRPTDPELEIDVIRREVRLVRTGRGSERDVLRTCRFEALAHAERQGSTFRLWDEDGSFLAEVCPADRNALVSLTSGLRDAGKLD